MTDEEAAVPKDFTAEFNIFGVVTGHRAHIKLMGPASKLKSMIALFLTFAETLHFEPEETGSSQAEKAPDQGDAESPKCQTCGMVMGYKEGKSRKGDDYAGYFCPKAKRGLPGHEPIWKFDWE